MTNPNAKPTESVQRKMVEVVNITRDMAYNEAISLIHEMRPPGCFGDEEGKYSRLEWLVMCLQLPAAPSAPVSAPRDENTMLKEFINEIFGGAAQGLLAYGRFRRKREKSVGQEETNYLKQIERNP